MWSSALLPDRYQNSSPRGLNTRARVVDRPNRARGSVSSRRAPKTSVLSPFRDATRLLPLCPDSSRVNTLRIKSSILSAEWWNTFGPYVMPTRIAVDLGARARKINRMVLLGIGQARNAPQSLWVRLRASTSRKPAVTRPQESPIKSTRRRLVPRDGAFQIHLPSLASSLCEGKLHAT